MLVFFCIHGRYLDIQESLYVNQIHFGFIEQLIKEEFILYNLLKVILIKQNYYHLDMSNDNNLLSFLQKQSLFSNSPNKPEMRNKSRSRDRIQAQQIQNNLNQAPIQGNFNQGQQFQANFNQNQQIQGNFNTSPQRQNNFIPAQQIQNANINTFNAQINHQSQSPGRQQVQIQRNQQIHYQNPIQNNISFQGLGATPNVNQNFSSSFNQFQGGNFNNGQVFESSSVDRNVGSLNISKNLVNPLKEVVQYSTSFQSARVETAQRLDDLAMKVRNKISELDVKIANFNGQLMSLIDIQFSQVKQRIYQVIQQSFRESVGLIEQYVNIQQMKFNQQILRTRQELYKEISSIESMREDINKPYWRNMAGVFITREFQGKIELMIKQSQSINYRSLNMEVNGGQFRELEKQLFEKTIQRLIYQKESLYGR